MLISESLISQIVTGLVTIVTTIAGAYITIRRENRLQREEIEKTVKQEGEATRKQVGTCQYTVTGEKPVLIEPADERPIEQIARDNRPRK